MKFVPPVRTRKQIDTIKKLLGEKKRNLLLFTFGINSALRISDLLNLKIDDVVESSSDKIRDYLSVKEKKTGKTKEIFLNDSIKKALKGYLVERKDAQADEFLFLSRKGGPIGRNQAWRILHDVGKSMGFENLATHSLRKTCAFHIFERTKNLALIQKLLNHSRSSDTIRYIGLDQAEMDRAYYNLNL